MSGREVTSTNTDAGSGSSSVFRSALWAAITSPSAWSMIVTRLRPSKGRNTARSIAALTCSILIEPVSPGSIVWTSACMPRANTAACGADATRIDPIDALEVCSASRVTPRGGSLDVQFNTCAMEIAVNRLPTPSGPESTRLGVNVSRAIARDSRVSRRRWPTISLKAMNGRILSLPSGA